MNIKEFMSAYTNHPVLFIGTGMSLRYLKNSFTWDGLLQKISLELYGDDREYLNMKSRCYQDGICKYEDVAKELEEKFNQKLEQDPDGKFKEINDIFFNKMREGQKALSRFKIYVASLLSNLDYREEMQDELTELKKARKNIGSIITTNYDKFAQEVFEFNPLIGNNILLSNPYGSVYKIHGCVDEPDKIILTQQDYEKFRVKYELIRAQLLSLFIHNPIIFLGYNVGDENIKHILKTIFTYVEPNSEVAEKIRRNFLLVEYERDSENIEISEHDIDISGLTTIRINKIRTDKFAEIYKELSALTLPISAMDVRKLQSIVKQINEGGSIQVRFTEDIETLDNGDRIIAIGSSKTISYNYQTVPEMMSNYFKIIEEANSQLLEQINKHKITASQYFPIYGFSKICSSIEKAEDLKEQQLDKLKELIEHIKIQSKNSHTKIDDIWLDENISNTYKINAIAWAIWYDQLNLQEVEQYLKDFNNKKITDYRKLLCMFDYKKYN